MTSRPRSTRSLSPALLPGLGLAVSLGLTAGLISPAHAAAAPTAGATAAVSTESPAGRASGTVWLCKPGRTPDACDGSLRTTDQRTGRVSTPPRAQRPTVDCFYLYPTVSTQPTMNADLTIEPAQTSIAEYQAARFSEICRVIAPMYRQVTLAGLGGVATEQDWAKAYRSARSGWRSYLREYNSGRGFVLIGHSQGSSMLRRIIAEEIDPNPGLRRRLVGAVLPGTTIAVPKHRVVGGDFTHVPACTTAGEPGCVQSWSTYNDLTPPQDAYFGRLDRDEPTPRNWEVMCTEPARIAGAPPRYRGLKPSVPPASPFDIGLEIMFGGQVPTAATPWVEPAATYRGKCIRQAGSHYLNVSSIGDAPVLDPAPDIDWGLHIVDINAALPHLVSGVGRQIRAYNAAHGVPARG